MYRHAAAHFALKTIVICLDRMIGLVEPNCHARPWGVIMGLTSALNTSLNGLSLNETAIDVLSNNIANAGTNAFKSSQVQFSTQLARTLSFGSRPTATNGGTNAKQIGLGATVAAIIPDFSQGSITNTTTPSDLAIQGDGFFIVESQEGNVYTRNGTFRLNSENVLTNSQGLRVQAYGVDDDFNIINTELKGVQIPLGELSIAEATENVVMSGALSPQGDIGTHGTLLETAPLVIDGGGTALSSTATLLSAVRLASDPATPLFTGIPADLELTAVKGGRTLDTKTLAVTATTTVQEYMDFLDETLGLQSNSVPTDTDGIAVGVDLSGGMIRAKGNRGSVNDISVPVGSMVMNGGVVGLDVPRNGEAADGESTFTTFVVFDSLGEALNVRMSAYKESETTNSTTFRYILESDNNSSGIPGDVDIALGSSTVVFDSVGNVADQPNNSFSIERNGSAAVSPMVFEVDMSAISGISSSGSNLNLKSQDGSSPGVLTSFVIDEQGVINGVFDNGVIRTLGQVVLARFTNPGGLLQNGGDTFREGVSSGEPLVSNPGTFGAGTIRAGAIELSNTDIGRSLVDLIVASTNYRGNARVIDSTNRLVDELLLLGR